MREDEVIFYVKRFFEEHSYRVREESPVGSYKVDLLAEKNEEKYFVECKGETSILRSHEIHVMVGQLVSEMREVSPTIHYSLAMPLSLSTYLRDFGIQGLKLLGLHLFVVGQGDIWSGKVIYLDTESLISYIKELRKNPQNAWLPLLTLRKKLI